MSRLSISRSYAVLVGMESYTRTKGKEGQIESSLKHEKDKVLHPEKVKEQNERQKDKSQSAEKERQHLEKLRLEDEKRRQSRKEEGNLSSRMARKLGLRAKENGGGERTESEGRGIQGVGPEDGVPPLEEER